MGTLLVAVGFWFMLSSHESYVETYFTGFKDLIECESARESKIEKYKDWPAVVIGPCYELKPQKGV